MNANYRNICTMKFQDHRWGRQKAVIQSQKQGPNTLNEIFGTEDMWSK